MASTLEIPQPSARPKQTLSASSVQESEPESESASPPDPWYQIISVAFLETLESRLFNTPAASEPASSISERWNRLCEAKGVEATASDFEPADDIDKSGLVDGDGFEEGEAIGSIAKHKSPSKKSGMKSVTTTTTTTTTQVKRGRGRPKRKPPAIIAAEKNLRKIGELSDRQWAAQKIRPDGDEAAIPSAPRKRGRPPKEPSQAPKSNDLPIDKTADPKAGTAAANIPHSSPPPSEIRPRKALVPPHLKSCSESPSQKLYFTLLPRPPRQSSSSAFTPAFSFRMNFKPRSLNSDKLVMLCTRARVRQNRLKDTKHARVKVIPKGLWLGRNLKLMRKIRKNVQPLKESNTQAADTANTAINAASTAEGKEKSLKHKADDASDVPESSQESTTRKSKRKKRKTL